MCVRNKSLYDSVYPDTFSNNVDCNIENKKFAFYGNITTKSVFQRMLVLNEVTITCDNMHY